MFDGKVCSVVLDNVSEAPALIWMAERAYASRHDRAPCAPKGVLVPWPQVVVYVNPKMHQPVGVVFGGLYCAARHNVSFERSG